MPSTSSSANPTRTAASCRTNPHRTLPGSRSCRCLGPGHRVRPASRGGSLGRRHGRGIRPGAGRDPSRRPAILLRVPAARIHAARRRRSASPQPQPRRGLRLPEAEQSISPREAVAVQLPLPRFITASTGNGHVNVHPDPDGALRRIELVIRFGDGLYPSLILETARLALGLPRTRVRLTADQSIQVGSTAVPTDGSGALLLSLLRVGRHVPEHPSRGRPHRSRRLPPSRTTSFLSASRRTGSWTSGPRPSMR